MEILTLAAAQQLKGKKISTIYYGYRGQDGTSEFVVGDIVTELDYYRTQECKGWNNRAEYWESFMTPAQLEEKKSKLLLLDENSLDTMMYCHDSGWFPELTFTCSDSDRAVSFTVIEG